MGAMRWAGGGTGLAWPAGFLFWPPEMLCGASLGVIANSLPPLHPPPAAVGSPPVLELLPQPHVGLRGVCGETPPQYLKRCEGAPKSGWWVLREGAHVCCWGLWTPQKAGTGDVEGGQVPGETETPGHAPRRGRRPGGGTREGGCHRHPERGRGRRVPVRAGVWHPGVRRWWQEEGDKRRGRGPC